MFELEQIEREVQKQVEAGHNALLSSFQDYILNYQEQKFCSYMAQLGIYRELKVRIHRLEVNESRWGNFEGIHYNIEKHRLHQNLKYNLEKTREKMYLSPCKKCSACFSRKKAWPDDRKL